MKNIQVKENNSLKDKSITIGLGMQLYIAVMNNIVNCVRK